MPSRFSKLQEQLFKPVDIASLAFYRIAFGLIMFWEVFRYFQKGWIKRYYVDPNFFFSYEGFEWIKPLDGNGMYILFMVLGILALFIVLGLFYRVSTWLFFFGFTYMFLLDKTNYLNHFYLISLLSFLLTIVPANRRYSLDALLFPSIRSQTIPAWALYITRFQIGVAYFFGGVAKLNYDWLHGQPMRMWLSESTDFPVIGKYLTMPNMDIVFSYGGLMLDLLIVPFLMWRKTRIIAFIIITCFHLTNAQLFMIGIFPWFMIAATTIFFDPDWCRGILDKIAKTFTQHNLFPLEAPRLNFQPNKILIYSLSVFMMWQVLWPLRHNLIPGNVNWTEEGHKFSWHMKLRDKNSKASFYVKDLATGEEWKIKKSKYLTRRQRKKMKNRPDMVFQFAHYLDRVYKRKGYKEVAVRAEVYSRLNGRKRQLMIDPNVDLTSFEKQEFPAPWITKLHFPLYEKKSIQKKPGTKEENLIGINDEKK